MDAKELWIQKHGPYNGPIDPISAIKFAEDYHLAKSNEDAEERCEMAAKYWENEVMSMFKDEEELPDKFPKPSQIFKYGQLAAFGKEDK